MRACNSCSGKGGVIVNEDLSIDFEVCMKCDGNGYIYEDTDEDKLREVRKTTKRKR